MENNVVHYRASNTDGFLWRDTFISQLGCIGLFGTNRTYLHLVKLKLQEEFHQKPTQYSKGNNVLDAPASNTDGFNSRDTWVSST
jgi:hypothetical protein